MDSVTAPSTQGKTPLPGPEVGGAKSGDPRSDGAKSEPESEAETTDEETDESDGDETDNKDTKSDGAKSVTQKLVDSLKPGYPATALVNVLLQHYGVDFPTYKRNIRTSAALWNKWNSVYEAILGQIKIVKEATDEPKWDSFDKYTNAIPEFEQLLLELKFTFETNLTSAVPPKDEVVALITFMSQWLENRKEILESSKALAEDHYSALFPEGQALNAEAEVKKALREDDVFVLKELIGKIAEHKLTDGDILGRGSDDQFVTQVKAKVQEIKTNADSLGEADDEQMAQIVFAAMGLLIPFLAHEHNEDNAHVISKDVWTAAQLFAEQTADFSSAKGKSVEDFTAKWKVYEEVLRKTLGAFAMQMVTLMRYAAQVRRPFFGRTVGVVRMWRALSESKTLQGEESAAARKKLAKLLEDTETEFKTTKTAITSFAASLDSDIDERRTAYTTLVGRLQEEIKQYNSAEWDKVNDAYQAGCKKDDEHLKKFREFVEKHTAAAKIAATEEPDA